MLKQRLTAYRAQTAPLVDYYRGKGALRAVDGMASISDVAAAIGRALADAAFRPVPAGKAAGGRKAASSKAARAPGKPPGKVKAAKAAKTGAKSDRQGRRKARRKAAAKAGAGKRPQKSRKTRALAEVDEMRMNPLITQYSVGHSSNDAGPQSAGEGVALPLGAPFRDAGTGRMTATGRATAGRNRSEVVARIAGVNIPTNKRVVIALQYIHGIGQKNAKDIMEKVNIPAERRVSQLTDQEVLQIREMIDRDYMVEGDLRREVAMNIKRLMDLGCYRGLRHRKGLPVRGQRTHTNARTRKGPAKAIAGKKKATA